MHQEQSMDMCTLVEVAWRISYVVARAPLDARSVRFKIGHLVIQLITLSMNMLP